MKDIGVVIVTYNSGAEIGACLDSLFQPGLERPADVIVVDNASQDRTREEVRQRREAKLIANPNNTGFASAVNRGIQATSCPYVLLLNPDTTEIYGLATLAAACEPRGIAAAAGRLVDDSGHPQKGFAIRRFPTPLALGFEVLGLNRLWRANPVNRRYRCLDFDYETPADVEQPAGAFLMIRRDVWEEVGGFDERFYPLWFEDVDYLKRVHDLGYVTRYVPTAVAGHKGAHSAGMIPWECRQLYWYGSFLRYTSKHLRSSARRAICVLVMVGSIGRMVCSLVTQRNLKPLGVFAGVIRLAFVSLLSHGEQVERKMSGVNAALK